MPCCSKRLAFQIFLGIIQGLIVLTQGSVLNYYIISRFSKSNTTYFFFLGDFICIFTFAGSLAIAYRYLVEHHLNKKNANQSFIYSPKRFIPNYSTSKFGVLPFIYLSWALYALLLLGKIAVIFTSDIPNNLSTKEVAGPQLLRVAIALSGIVFLILVEGHNWAEEGSPRYIYATSVCTKTGIEVLDTVSLLSIVVTGLGGEPAEELTTDFIVIIVVISGMNFLLPILILYKLSLGQHNSDKFPLPITVLHTILHLCCIDIPFLCVRLFLWIKYHHNSSIFIMKNVFGIIYAVRGIYPDLRNLCCSDKPVNHVKEYLPSDKITYIDDTTGDEEKFGEQMDELKKINPTEKKE